MSWFASKPSDDPKKTDKPTPDDKPGTLAPSRPALSQDDRITALIEEAATRTPPQLAQFIKKAGPILIPVTKALVFFINTFGPLYFKAGQLLYVFLSALPWELLMAITGLCLCFCGGGYCASIAACEAFLMTGWPATKHNLTLVYNDIVAMHEKQTEDDQKDDDGDGIADVKQISTSELVDRKIRVAAKAVEDPQRLSGALGGLYVSWLSVQATLRIQFARTINLALSCSQFVEFYLVKFLFPIISPLVGKEFVHWIPMWITSITKAFFVFWAWKMQEVVSSVQSGLRGGLMFSRGLLNWLNKNGIKNFFGFTLEHEHTYLDEIVGYAVAVCGIWVQWNLGYSLPFPLNYVMWPLDLVEWYIRYEVTTGGQASA